MRTAKEIEDMKWALRRYGSERNYFLFVFGTNTGLRVSDIVPLTVGDVRDKSHVVIREQKTNKTKRFMLPIKLWEEIEEYTDQMSDAEYLFPSRKGNPYPSLSSACGG
ncbi:integrase [Peribacillus huizhouensis]|uniref:Integrase n=1 Tax=Peribacillus huizhouensis TaxID=1501239 RepID=A0ABR6CWK7_9BACI|nr:integrase [Peribacillus huizhouensis]